MDDGLFTTDYVAIELGMAEDEADSCRKFLEAKDLIDCVYVDNDTLNLKHALWGFAPSHKGRHHAEFARMEFFKLVLESILLPILVSVLTALLVAA